MSPKVSSSFWWAWLMPMTQWLTCHNILCVEISGYWTELTSCILAANGAVNVWEEINQALSAKKAELSKEDGWSRADSSGRSAWSLRALRRSALGPTMAFLRAQNGIWGMAPASGLSVVSQCFWTSERWEQGNFVLAFAFCHVHKYSKCRQKLNVFCVECECAGFHLFYYRVVLIFCFSYLIPWGRIFWWR